MAEKFQCQIDLLTDLSQDYRVISRGTLIKFSRWVLERQRVKISWWVRITMRFKNLIMFRCQKANPPEKITQTKILKPWFHSIIRIVFPGRWNYTWQWMTNRFLLKPSTLSIRFQWNSSEKNSWRVSMTSHVASIRLFAMRAKMY